MLLYVIKQVIVVVAFVAIACYCYRVISTIDEDDNRDSD